MFDLSPDDSPRPFEPDEFVQEPFTLSILNPQVSLLL